MPARLPQWTNTNATVQPDALVDASRGLVDAGNWSVTDGWNVPANAVSGVYLARVQRLDSNGDPIDGAVNQIPFIVRNDGETHDIVLQTSDTTWQAYNGWGGNNGEVGANLYGDMNDSINWDPIPGAGSYSQDRAYAVSYNRPFITATAPARRRARRTICSAPTMRRSTGSRSRATTSPTSRASTPTGSGPTTSRTTSRSSRSAMTNTGRATSAQTSRKRAIPA